MNSLLLKMSDIQIFLIFYVEKIILLKVGERNHLYVYNESSVVREILSQ